MEELTLVSSTEDSQVCFGGPLNLVWLFSFPFATTAKTTDFKVCLLLLYLSFLFLFLVAHSYSSVFTNSWFSYLVTEIRLQFVVSHITKRKFILFSFLQGKLQNMHFVYIICSWTPFHRGAESLTHLISVSFKTVTYTLNFKVNCSLRSLRSLKWNIHPRKAELISINLKKKKP